MKLLLSGYIRVIISTVGQSSIYLVHELAEPMLNEGSSKLGGLAVSRLYYIKFIVKVLFPLWILLPFQVTGRRDMPGLTQPCTVQAGVVTSCRATWIPLSGQTQCLIVTNCGWAVNICTYTAH